MKLRRRHRVAHSENDRQYLIEDNTKHVHSKVQRVVWKFVKGTWKVFKNGFKTAITSQPFCMALDPTAIATTIFDYEMRNS